MKKIVVVGENAKRYFLNEIQKKAGTPFIATPTEPIKKIGLAFEAIFNNLRNSSLEI